jgi:hypothetical protein
LETGNSNYGQLCVLVREIESLCCDVLQEKIKVWVLTRKCNEKQSGTRSYQARLQHSDALSSDIFTHSACHLSLLELDGGEPSSKGDVRDAHQVLYRPLHLA